MVRSLGLGLAPASLVHQPADLIGSPGLSLGQFSGLDRLGRGHWSALTSGPGFPPWPFADTGTGGRTSAGPGSGITSHGTAAPAGYRRGTGSGWRPSR